MSTEQLYYERYLANKKRSMSDFSPAEHFDNIVWRTQKFKMFKMLWLYNTCTGHSHQLFLCVFQTQSQVFLGYTYLH